MTVDLSKLKPGDTVVHRNGGKSKITSVWMDSDKYFWLRFSQNGYAMVFQSDGTFLSKNSPFCIVAIEPAAEKKTPLEEWIEGKIHQPISSHDFTIYNEIYKLAQAINETLKDMKK